MRHKLSRYEIEKRIEEKYENQKFRNTIPNYNDIKRIKSNSLVCWRTGKSKESISRQYNRLIHITMFEKVRRYYLENVREKEVC